MALHDEGGYASNVGRPLGQIFVPPAYGISFFNKRIDAPLVASNIVSDVPALFEYEEELGDPNLEYSRVMHFSVTDSSTGKVIQDELYLPYINLAEISSEKTRFHTKPLVEVVNPRITKLSPNLFVMYFFSNFTSDELPDDNAYNDDPQYLRRLVEFATNDPDELDNKIPPDIEAAPYPNDRNYYVDDPNEDSTPRIAFLSCVLRVFNANIDGTDRIFVVAEKPIINTWVGHRFALDSHPPLLVNKVQSVEWAADKVASDSLTESSVLDDPPREVPYHHLISRINTVMYPGYAGINFYTKPITDFYDLALDHIFDVAGESSKKFDFYAHGRKMKSLGVKQEDSPTKGDPVVSDFSPFERHFGVFEVDVTRYDSSSSSTAEPSYEVVIPGSMDVRGSDKPEFWSYYWDVCDEDAPAAQGGEIIVDFDVSKGLWYGNECIDGITMYAKIEFRPYGYYGNKRQKYWLTIGPKTVTGSELDVLWQGYRIENEDAFGEYTRYYSLADSPLDTITVNEV